MKLDNTQLEQQQQQKGKKNGGEWTTDWEEFDCPHPKVDDTETITSVQRVVTKIWDLPAKNEGRCSRKWGHFDSDEDVLTKEKNESTRAGVRVKKNKQTKKKTTRTKKNSTVSNENESGQFGGGRRKRKKRETRPPEHWNGNEPYVAGWQRRRDAHRDEDKLFNWPDRQSAASDRLSFTRTPGPVKQNEVPSNAR